jgi:hypothetical protein
MKHGRTSLTGNLGLLNEWMLLPILAMVASTRWWAPANRVSALVYQMEEVSTAHRRAA